MQHINIVNYILMMIKIMSLITILKSNNSVRYLSYNTIYCPECKQL